MQRAGAVLEVEEREVGVLPGAVGRELERHRVAARRAPAPRRARTCESPSASSSSCWCRCSGRSASRRTARRRRAARTSTVYVGLLPQPASTRSKTTSRTHERSALNYSARRRRTNRAVACRCGGVELPRVGRRHVARVHLIQHLATIPVDVGVVGERLVEGEAARLVATAAFVIDERLHAAVPARRRRRTGRRQVVRAVRTAAPDRGRVGAPRSSPLWPLLPQPTAMQERERGGATQHLTAR